MAAEKGNKNMANISTMFSSFFQQRHWTLVDSGKTADPAATNRSLQFPQQV